MCLGLRQTLSVYGGGIMRWMAQQSPSRALHPWGLSAVSRQPGSSLLAQAWPGHPPSGDAFMVPFVIFQT